MNNTFTGEYLLCCDWGTSSFRLRLVSCEGNQVIDEVKTNLGIAQVFKEWKVQSVENGESRADFYFNVLKGHLEQLTMHSLQGFSSIPIILTGMASSTIGIQDLPYAELPFHSNGQAVCIRLFEPGASFSHPVFLVSGVRSSLDVMRGEEIQYLGLVNSSDVKLPDAKRYALVFPGTHSKHIFVEDGLMVDFKTFMTGEVFNIIAEHSILKDSILAQAGSLQEHGNNMHAFVKGVQMSSATPFLHAIFTVRTNQLFSTLSEEENYHYLSGLIIGSELQTLANLDLPIVICSGPNLSDHYRLAAQELSIQDVTSVSSDLIDQATIRGQIQVFRNQKSSRHG